MSMPYSVKLEIDHWKEKNKKYSSGLSDEAIYRSIKREKPYLKWDDGDTYISSQKAKKRKARTEPSHVNAFSSMFDLWVTENSADWMKAAYNHSLTGTAEELITGKSRYNIDDYDPNIVEDIASMAFSFLMPLDLITFAGGGKFVGQPLAKMASEGMKARAGAKFGKRALDSMIPAAMNQAGTLATYEGAMMGLQAGINDENVLGGIAKGVMHGGILGGAAGLVGGGLSYKHANVLKEFAKQGKIAKPGGEATSVLTSKDYTKMYGYGVPGQILGESAVFSAGETLETAIDPDRDVRFKDIIVSLGKNAGLFGLLKGQKKLFERAKNHIKLLEEQEVLNKAMGDLKENKSKDSKTHSETYDDLGIKAQELIDQGHTGAAKKLLELRKEVKAKELKIDKEHFDNLEGYKKLRNIFENLESNGGELPATPENLSFIVNGLNGLIEAEARLGKSGMYKALTKEMKETSKQASSHLDRANNMIAEQAKKTEKPKTAEETLLDLRNEAESLKVEKVKDINTGKSKPYMEGTAVELESALAQARKRIQEARELESAKAGMPSVKKQAKAFAKEMGKVEPMDAFIERGLDTKVEISELKAGAGKHAKTNKYEGKKAHELINEAKLSNNTKKKIYLGAKEFFPQSGGKMAHLYEVIKYAEYLERNGIKFDESTGAHVKAYLKKTGQWNRKNVILNRLQKFYGGTHSTAWGKISQGQGYAGRYMRTGIGLANVGVLDVKWADVQLGKATRITSTQKGTMSEVIGYLPEKINTNKKALEIPNIVKKPIAKNTVQALFETFYKIPKRISEMIGLRKKDIDIKNGTIKFNITKGKSKVEVFDLKALDPA